MREILSTILNVDERFSTTSNSRYFIYISYFWLCAINAFCGYADHTDLIAAIYYSLTANKFFDIDDVASACGKKEETLVAEKFARGTKGAVARTFPIAFSFFLSFCFSFFFCPAFSIEVARRGEIKAQRCAISEANFVYRRSSGLPNCRGSSDGYA